MSNTRVLDISFPVKYISRLAQHEKSIKYGLASSLHFWPGRRPQVAAQAAISAALTPALIVGEIGKSKADARIADIAPKVLDPFGGGGGFALEALRLGCQVVTNDLNPVAHLLQRATVEFPHRFGANLAKMVDRWGQRILSQTKSSLPSIYGPPKHDVIPVACWWCWGMTCPGCETWIPFLYSRRLLQDTAQSTILTTRLKDGQIQFGVRRGTPADTVSGNFGVGGAGCLRCGKLLPRREIQRRAQAGEMTRKLLGVCERHGGKLVGRAAIAEEQLWATDLADQIKRCFASIPSGVPEEKIRCDSDHVRTALYGLRQFNDLFLPRQLLVLGTLVKQTRAVVAMNAEGLPANTVQALSLYLALAITRTAERNSQLCVWQPKTACISSVMARSTLSFCPDFSESNILGNGSGSYAIALGRVTHAVEKLAGNLAGSSGSVSCRCGDAVLTKPGKFDLIITDPPYFDSIAYGNLADFFEIWLRRSLLGLDLGWDRTLPDWQTGRVNELLVDYWRDGGMSLSVERLNESTQKIMRRMRQVLKPDGRLVFVFACTFVEGWAIVGDALRQNGFRVRSVWPVQTECQGRLRTRSSRALSCSLWMCCDTVAEDSFQSLASAIERFRGRLPAARKDWRRWGLPKLDLPWFLLAQSLREFTALRKSSAVGDFQAKRYLQRISGYLPSFG